MNKSKPQPKKKKKTQAILQNFSGLKPASKAAVKCPLASNKLPKKPCNLSILKLVEPDARGAKEAPRIRTMVIRKNQQLQNNVCPTLLPNGGTFQITAPSVNGGEPKMVDLQVVTDAVCSSSEHPHLKWSNMDGSNTKVIKTAKMGFHRNPMLGDDFRFGFFSLLNAALQSKPAIYPVSVDSCGMPVKPGAGSVENLNGNIEVFPADQYELELVFPAAFSPESLDYKTASKSWTSKRDKDDKALKKHKDKAAKAYDKDPHRKELAPDKSSYLEIAENFKKEQLGYVEDADPAMGGLKIKFTQSDGDRESEAPINEVVALLRFIRDAQFRMAQVQEWVSKITPPGVGYRFSADCKFLIGTIKAKWGYSEHVDHRVFVACEGSLDLDIVKVAFDAAVGFQSYGAADVMIVGKGEGTIGASLFGIVRENPDKWPKPNFVPRGSIKFGLGVEGRLMWMAKAEGIIEVCFKASTEELEFLSDKAALAGSIVIGREEISGKITTSCLLWGSTTSKHLFKEENKRMVVINF